MLSIKFFRSHKLAKIDVLSFIEFILVCIKYKEYFYNLDN